MKQPRTCAVLFFLLLCHFHLQGSAATEVTFYVINKCPFPIWPATAPNTGHPVIADGGFFLPADQIHRFTAPPAWSGRIWGRTDCNFHSNWQPACQTGDCDGRLACNGLIGTPPATLVQISLQPDRSKPTFYDISLVDGYNLPVSISTKPIQPNCLISGCNKSLIRNCPPELQVIGRDGSVVACKSACLAFDLDTFCCRNDYGTPEKCKPSVYSKLFKHACPSYFSYAYDNPPPMLSCSSREFVITFCPSKWGGDHLDM